MKANTHPDFNKYGSAVRHGNIKIEIIKVYIRDQSSDKEATTIEHSMKTLETITARFPHDISS